MPPDRLRRILLVSEGDPYLETALAYLPNTELYGVAPKDYGAATHPELFDLKADPYEKTNLAEKNPDKVK